jgi:hypothetical protein
LRWLMVGTPRFHAFIGGTTTFVGDRGAASTHAPYGRAGRLLSRSAISLSKFNLKNAPDPVQHFGPHLRGICNRKGTPRLSCGQPVEFNLPSPIPNR